MSTSKLRVIVTGAAGGLGKSIAQAFLRAGAPVILADVNAAALSQSAAELGENAHAVTADVSSESSVQGLFEEAERILGGVDVLVNNAGVMDRFDPVGDLDKKVWDRVLAVNLTGPYLTSKAAVNHFLKRDPPGGAILNVSSIGGLYGARAGAAYTASKHGLLGLTKNTAALYGKRGIRCNAISPGAMMTNISEAFNAGVNEVGQQTCYATMAMQPGLCDLTDVANLCVYLCSDEAKVVNGAIVTADGGWTAY